MFKSMILTIIGSLLFLASLPLGATMASAHGGNGGTNAGDGTAASCRAESIPDATRRIWNGLWAGANLDFSLIDDSDSRSTAAASSDQDCGTVADRPARDDTGATTQPARPATPEPTAPASPAAQPPQTVAGKYVAMGDSVAAGLGLTRPTNATSRDRTCGRSVEAYPYHVAAARQLQLTHVACSRATAGDLITPQGINNAPNPSRQIAAVFAGGKPELITVTAGANDAQWSRFMFKCYRSVCGTATDTRVANGALVLLQGKLLAFFTELEFRSNGQPPTVVMTGYYNPLSAACNAQTERLTAAELAWIQANVDALNQTIADVVARYPSARFAPVDFSGHDICSAEPWVQSLNDRAPIHPTAQGQRVIAESVLRTL